MKNALKRSFKKGELVHVVDYWGTPNGSQAFATEAKILTVNEKDKIFTAVLYGDTYQAYSFKDYGRLIFDTRKEAEEAADKLPKPKTIVYRVINKKVYKRLVTGIGGQYNDGGYDLVIELEKGKDVSTKEIGKSLFLNESDAREKSKK